MSNAVRYRTESRNGNRATFTLDPDNSGQPVNIPLLRKALDFVTTHPGVHEQGRWFGFAGTGDISGETPTARAEVVERVKARQEAEGSERVKALADEACGTTGCLYGWAVVIDSQDKEDGVVYVTVTETERWSEGLQRYVPTEVAELAVYDEEHGTDWEAIGADRLGLDEDNTSALSHATNSVGDLWRIASILTAGEIVVPEKFAAYDGVAEAEAWRTTNKCPCGCGMTA